METTLRLYPLEEGMLVTMPWKRECSCMCLPFLGEVHSICTPFSRGMSPAFPFSGECLYLDESSNRMRIKNKALVFPYRRVSCWLGLRKVIWWLGLRPRHQITFLNPRQHDTLLYGNTMALLMILPNIIHFSHDIVIDVDID